MGRDTDPQHASCFGQRFKNGGQHPFAGQMIGRRKAGRARTDDGHLFITWRQTIDLNLARIELIGGQAFQIPDGNRLIDLTAPAGVFAFVRANPPQDAGQRELLHNYFQGFFVLALLDHLDIALNIQSGRACQTTGGSVCFLNGKGSRDRLSVHFIGRLFIRKTFVVFVGEFHGTDLDTFPATRALGQIHKARLLPNPGLKVSAR